MTFGQMKTFDNRWGTKLNCWTTQNTTVASRNCGFNPSQACLGSNRKQQITAVASAWQPRILTDNNRKFLAKGAQKTKENLETLIAQANEGVKEWAVIKDDIVDNDGDPLSPENVSKVARARTNITHMAIARQRAFTDVDFLMVNAPTRAVAAEMCKHKLESYEEYQKAVLIIGDFHRKVSEKMGEAHLRKGSMLAGILAALEGFMAILKALLALIVKVFQGAVAAVQLFIKNPKVLLAVGAVVGLGALAFVLRPYMSIAAAVFRKKSRRKRSRR